MSRRKSRCSNKECPNASALWAKGKLWYALQQKHEEEFARNTEFRKLEARVAEFPPFVRDLIEQAHVKTDCCICLETMTLEQSKAGEVAYLQGCAHALHKRCADKLENVPGGPKNTKQCPLCRAESYYYTNEK